jgi:ASF1 like histone chaperone.
VVVVLQVVRNILSSEPRVTRFKINWDDTDTLHQSADDTTYKMDELVSSDGAVGFSEKNSQSVMEVM